MSDLLSTTSSQLYTFMMQVFLNWFSATSALLDFKTSILTLLDYAILWPEISDSLGSYA